MNRAFYEEHGYLIYRPTEDDYFTKIDCAARAFAAILHGREAGGAGQQRFKNKEGKFRHLFFAQGQGSAFRDIIGSAPVAAVARQLWDTQRLYVTHSKVSYKEVGERLDWFPHQDNGYKLANKVPLRSGMTMAVFLEDAEEKNGTIQVFPGSHKQKTLPHSYRREHADGSGQIIIDRLPDIAPLPIRAKKGDILVFSLDLVHQSGSNLSHGYRPILIFEVEPFQGYAVDEYGNPPLIINGSLHRVEKSICRLKGLPRKARTFFARFALLRRLYMGMKYGTS